MTANTAARLPSVERLTRELSSFSATDLAAGMQRVTRTVMSEGAVVITRHDQPSMVLMSVERYLALEKASEPDLEDLTRRFDDMFERMQGDGAAQAMANAFAMEPADLGKAAVKAARASRR